MPSENDLLVFTWLRAFRRLFEAPLMRWVLWGVPRLSRRGILRLARVLGPAAYLFSARLRRQGMANLDLAFGDAKTRAGKRRILRESFRISTLVLLDILWFSRDSAARADRWLVWGPKLKEALARRIPRVLVTGHFGNWEMLGYYWQRSGNPLMSVAMPLKNRKVEPMLQQLRKATGQHVVLREGAMKRLVRFLRAGEGTAGMLLDQNTAPDDGGTFVNFFGMPVAVSPAAGFLAAATGVEILFAFALPQANGTYWAEMPRTIAPEEIAALDRRSAAKELTQRITDVYEEVIRERPECWLWSYKRWLFVPTDRSFDGFPYYAKKRTGA